MGTTQISQGGQILHRILQLLSKIYPSFLRYRMTAHRPNQEGDTFQLEKGTRRSIHQAQGDVLICTCDQDSRYYQAVLRHD